MRTRHTPGTLLRPSAEFPKGFGLWPEDPGASLPHAAGPDLPAGEMVLLVKTVIHGAPPYDACSVQVLYRGGLFWAWEDMLQEAE